MDSEQYHAELVRAYAIVTTLLDMPLADMLQAARHAEAIGPFVAPTLFREQGGNLRHDIRVLEVLREAQDRLHRLSRSKSSP